MIRELAKLANGKHTVGLSTTLHTIRYGHPNIRGGGSFIQIPPAHWGNTRNEMLAVVGPDTRVQQDHWVNLAIGLDAPAPLSNVPAIRLLSGFADRAERFTGRIEAACHPL